MVNLRNKSTFRHQNAKFNNNPSHSSLIHIWITAEMISALIFAKFWILYFKEAT